MSNRIRVSFAKHDDQELAQKAVRFSDTQPVAPNLRVLSVREVKFFGEAGLPHQAQGHEPCPVICNRDVGRERASNSSG